MAVNLQFTLQIEGVGLVVRRLTWTQADALAVAKGLLQSGRIMLDDSKPNVPVLTGNLRSTGKILGPISKAFGMTQEVRVEYGGKPSKEVAGFPDPRALSPRTQVDYAVTQHETNPRRPRWLEDAFNREAPKTAQRVADELVKTLQRKVTVI